MKINIIDNRDRLFQIETDYACGGIVINSQKIVIKTAPIFSWMIDKNINEVKKWKHIKNIREILNEN